MPNKIYFIKEILLAILSLQKIEAIPYYLNHKTYSIYYNLIYYKFLRKKFCALKFFSEIIFT